MRPLSCQRLGNSDISEEVDNDNSKTCRNQRTCNCADTHSRLLDYYNFVILYYLDRMVFSYFRFYVADRGNNDFVYFQIFLISITVRLKYFVSDVYRVH